MPRNVEIKARIADVGAVRARAEAFADGPCAVLHQDETFFGVARGRLKLRVLGTGEAELIYYERPDVAGPKECCYARAPVHDADALHALLSRAFPVLGRVRKRRTLYVVGQTRIHVDEVKGLGDFVELEVVLRDKSAGRRRDARRPQPHAPPGRAQSRPRRGLLLGLDEAPPIT